MAKTPKETVVVQEQIFNDAPKQTPKNELIIAKNPVQFREQTPGDLIAMAISKDLDIEKLERLMIMKEKWDAKQQEKAYFEALEKFQSIVPELKKNKDVDFGAGKAKYSFHQLPAIEKAIRPSLSACGLSYKWIQKDEGNKIFVACVVMHKDGHREVGEWLSGDAEGSGGKNSVQAKISTVSYLRRCTVTGELGLSSADGDNDGKGGASEKKENPTPSQDQFATLMKNAVRGGIGAIREAQKHFSLTDDQIGSLKIAGNVTDEQIKKS